MPTQPRLGVRSGPERAGDGGPTANRTEGRLARMPENIEREHMMRRYAVVSVVTLLAFVSLLAATKERPFAFDFHCATTANFPRGELVVTVPPEALQKAIGSWADRAVKYDLDRDGRAEYFVPTTCGATGNCEWGVYRLSPTKEIGRLYGDRVYIADQSRWPRITTYDRYGLGKGEVHNYEYRSGRYVEVSNKMVEADENEAFLERMGKPNCSGR